jgi:hypothetical protein
MTSPQTASTPIEAASKAIESSPVGAPITLPYSQAVALWSALATVSLERDQARDKLADAPHDRDCSAWQYEYDSGGVGHILPSGDCTCWKSAAQFASLVAAHKANLVECPHWQQGAVTLRRACTSCEAAR